jgi:hypothetical protein
MSAIGAPASTRSAAIRSVSLVVDLSEKPCESRMMPVSSAEASGASSVIPSSLKCPFTRG